MIEELTTVALVEFDTHNRFKARAAGGSAARGLEILDELDRLESIIEIAPTSEGEG
jgi:hypothetical protein